MDTFRSYTWVLLVAVVAQRVLNHVHTCGRRLTLAMPSGWWLAVEREAQAEALTNAELLLICLPSLQKLGTKSRIEHQGSLLLSVSTCYTEPAERKSGQSWDVEPDALILPLSTVRFSLRLPLPHGYFRSSPRRRGQWRILICRQRAQRTRRRHLMHPG